MATTKKPQLSLVDNNKDDETSEAVTPGKNDKSQKVAAFWKEQVEFVEQESRPWNKKGNDVIKRFRDERNKADESTLRRLNMLWTNIKTLKPALYGKKPIPVVERKFLQKDTVGRISATMLERATKNQMDDNGLHEAVSRAVMDYLLPGRGIVWVRYEPEIGKGDSLPVRTQSGVEDELNEINENADSGADLEDADEEDKLETTGEQVLSEQAPVDYIDWHDFLIFPAKARTWAEVQAIGKRVYVSKKEARARFGEEVAKDLKGDTTPIGQSSNRQSYATSPMFRDINERNIIVYEIWNKTDRKVYWIANGYDYLCDVKDDFLKLKRFFPVPEPISSTLTNNSLIPVPDYYEYQDQAIQIDEITQRLALLTKACKVAGTYDASNAPLKRLLTEGVENELLPVDAWAVHADKGGVKGGISFLPIDEIQKVIQTLQEVRQQLMQDLDLITGISDIIRGTTDSRETLGGIRLKNNNAGTRLSDRQNEVARFARDAVAIVAEIIAKHFDDKTIVESSGILFDEEMSPEEIIEEFIAANKPPQQNNQQQPMGMGMPGMLQSLLGGGAQQQQQGPQSNPFQNAPGALPMAGAVPGMQQQPGAPQPLGGLPGQSQQSPSNIVPFPNMGQQPQQQQEPEIIPPDPTELVVDKITRALRLLRSDVPRGYRIEIETDSTIFGDAMQERQDAVEFITAVMQFLTQAGQVAKELPEMVPLLGRFLQFGVRKFRVGRDLESAIDMFVRQMDKKSKDMIKNPQMSPEQQESNMKMIEAQLGIQGQREKIQMEHQSQQANDQRDLQKAHMEDQRQAQLNQMEMELAQREHQLKIEEMQLKHQIAMAELKGKNEQMQLQAHIAQQQGQQKMAQSQMQMQQDQVQHQQTIEMGQQEHQQNVEEANTQHQQTMEQTKLQNQQATVQHDQKMTQMKMQATEKDKARKDKAKQPKGPK